MASTQLSPCSWWTSGTFGYLGQQWQTFLVEKRQNLVSETLRIKMFFESVNQPSFWHNSSALVADLHKYCNQRISMDLASCASDDFRLDWVVPDVVQLRLRSRRQSKPQLIGGQQLLEPKLIRPALRHKSWNHAEDTSLSCKQIRYDQITSDHLQSFGSGQRVSGPFASSYQPFSTNLGVPLVQCTSCAGWKAKALLELCGTDWRLGSAVKMQSKTLKLRTYEHEPKSTILLYESQPRPKAVVHVFLRALSSCRQANMSKRQTHSGWTRILMEALWGKAVQIPLWSPQKWNPKSPRFWKIQVLLQIPDSRWSDRNSRKIKITSI